ncbi:hypothetical protein E3N88_06318 [Mikania micrantha]|uniref:Uncharacterized protein n=1 Tax=Mikania micrantha TaxID=192012 RepID=A0A5N6PPB9_9ASTR|nr:hypothetical protein E3N88_06318 [Mikania micrantha]
MLEDDTSVASHAAVVVGDVGGQRKVPGPISAEMRTWKQVKLQSIRSPVGPAMVLTGSSVEPIGFWLEVGLAENTVIHIGPSVT